jgi:hypothetical protein
VGGAVAARLLQHEAAHVLGAERIELKGLLAEAPVEETPDRIQIGPHGGRRQITLTDQVSAKWLANTRSFVGRLMLHCGGDHTLLPQIRQQQRKHPSIVAVRTKLPVSTQEKGFEPRLIQSGYRKVFVHDPGAQCRKQPHRVLRRPSGIPAFRQLLGECVDIGAQRTGVQPYQNHRIGKKVLNHGCLLNGRSDDPPEETSRIMPSGQPPHDMQPSENLRSYCMAEQSLGIIGDSGL